MPNDCIPLAAVQNFASKDVNRIIGQIGRVLARKSPYINSIDGGTLPNVSDVVRSVVEEMAVPAASLAAPTFVNDTTLCGVGATPDQVGSTEYQFQLQTLRGAGPRVCVKQARTAFKGSYLQAQVSLEKTILQIINADIRYQYLIQSGVKYVVNSTRSFSQNLTGDMQQINTKFANVLPDASLNFKTLYRIGTFLREEMLAEPFATKDGEFFQFLASADQIENLRNDADVKEDLCISPLAASSSAKRASAVISSWAIAASLLVSTSSLSAPLALMVLATSFSSTPSSRLPSRTASLNVATQHGSAHLTRLRSSSLVKRSSVSSLSSMLAKELSVSLHNSQWANWSGHTSATTIATSMATSVSTSIRLAVLSSRSVRRTWLRSSTSVAHSAAIRFPEIGRAHV